MVLYCRIFILFFILLTIPLHATRWPWLISYNSHPLSKKKRVIQSRKTFNIIRARESVHHLFCTEKIFQQFYPQDSLEDVCANARKKRSLTVRVLLDECNRKSSVQWRFTADKGFIAQAINDTYDIAK